MIGQTVSHYRIINKLGEGGMGVVYIAEDTFLTRRVAVKMMNVETGKEHYRKRFLREAQAVSLLNHPNIASVLDYGETQDGRPFIVMELIEGQTLEQLLKQGELTLSHTLEIIEDVAEALSEAHYRGIIHRDIKPSNIAITKRGEVKVLDFGLAKQLNGDGVLPEHGSDHQALFETRTREGMIIGTPLYLSPEQALGVQIDTRSDIFSLGSVLYEGITGRPPFVGNSPVEICANVIRDNPVPPSRLNLKLPSQLDSVTLKALAKDAAARYQTVDEFRTALRTARESLSTIPDLRLPYLSRITGAIRTGVQTILPDTIRRPRFLAGVFLASVTLAMLLVVGSALFRRSSSPPPPSAEAVRLFSEGMDALVNGAYFSANRALERSVSVDGSFALAQARLAETYSELDYEDKAKEAMLRADALLLSGMSGLSADDAAYVQAIHSVVTGDFEGAAAKYLEIAGRTSGAGKTLAYMSAARSFEKSGLVSKAVETYRRIIEQNPQAAAAFMRLGVIHGRRLAQGDAFGALQTAEALYREQKNQEGLAEVFYQRGYLLNNLGKPDEAREQLQLALDVARADGDRPQAIKTLVQMGISFYLSGKSDIAEQYIASAVEQAQAEGSESLVANGLVDLGNVFFLRGKYDVAERYFKQALEIAARNKSRRAEARAALSLGSLRMQQGKTDAAINSVEQALSFYSQGQYFKETSSALLLLGRARDYKGDYAGAADALGRQLQVAEKVGDQAQVAQSHVEIGTSLQHQERYIEALEHFGTSLQINRSLDLGQNVGYDLMNRGHLLWQLGRYDEAQRALDDAADVARRPGGENGQLLAWVELFKARLALSQRDLRVAREKSEVAYNLSGQQFKDIAAQARYVLGMTSALSGTPRAGISQCTEALALAQLTGDPRLIAYAKLALAEASLEGGDAASALTNALSARESFDRSGQLESHWRALLIAALASRSAGDSSKAEEYAQQATATLTELSQRWGEAFDLYAGRPDVRAYRKRLEEINGGG
jgi:serine/threonine protein kinase/lipopolysaccharide biosynthesis regulator YciM